MGGATLLAIMGGYGLAKFRFPGRRAVFVVVIGAISVPGIALAVPQFPRCSPLNLTNTPGLVIPSLVNVRPVPDVIFSTKAVPTELLEAARVDGAGEFRTFSRCRRLAGAGHRDHGPVRDRGDVEQLFPPLIMPGDRLVSRSRSG